MRFSEYLWKSKFIVSNTKHIENKSYTVLESKYGNLKCI